MCIRTCIVAVNMRIVSSGFCTYMMCVLVLSTVSVGGSRRARARVTVHNECSQPKVSVKLSHRVRVRVRVRMNNECSGARVRGIHNG